MLNDWDRMVARIDSWVPREHVETVRAIARDINAAMAGFIRGQGTVCLILGIFYAVALIAAGLNFGLLIGLTAGSVVVHSVFRRGHWRHSRHRHRGGAVLAGLGADPDHRGNLCRQGSSWRATS
jgi:hypothetical protein